LSASIAENPWSAVERNNLNEAKYWIENNDIDTNYVDEFPLFIIKPSHFKNNIIVLS